jgi:hypothetical protein
MSRVSLGPPNPGTIVLCILCAHEKPYGVWDSNTGAAVCKDCRDAARAHENMKADLNKYVQRWDTVLRLLGGCTVANSTEQYWSVKTPVAPKEMYRNNQAEFTAAIDAAGAAPK